MTAANAVRWLAVTKSAFRYQVQMSIRDAAGFARTEAIRLSSGGYSLTRLAQMDHPYATRHGGAAVPYGDPAIINAQSGGFRAGWQINVGTYSARLYNFSPIGQFLVKGTSKMIARPIDQRIREAVAKRFRDQLEIRIAKALK